MTDAAFKATFSDFRLIKGRKVVQFVFELPVEQADHALEVLGGVPRPDIEAWAGIARINPKATSAERPAEESEPKERRAFTSLPLAQQAAMKCNDAAFARFLFERYDATDPAEYVRKTCGVTSRREIAKGTPAGTVWIELLAEFDVWMRAPV
jgi:hypothetical protein